MHGQSREQGWRSSESTRRPSINVARVRFPVLTPFAGWVCCWFSSLLREVSLRVLRFSSLHKNQFFQITSWTGNSGWIATLWMCHWNAHSFVFETKFIDFACWYFGYEVFSTSWFVDSFGKPCRSLDESFKGNKQGKPTACFAEYLFETLRLLRNSDSTMKKTQ